MTQPHTLRFHTLAIEHYTTLPNTHTNTYMMYTALHSHTYMLHITYLVVLEVEWGIGVCVGRGGRGLEAGVLHHNSL
jgi:hypothetical protein